MQKLSEINKKAWEIRKESAIKFNCLVMEISWQGCFIMAKEYVEIKSAIQPHAVKEEMEMVADMTNGQISYQEALERLVGSHIAYLDDMDSRIENSIKYCHCDFGYGLYVSVN